MFRSPEASEAVSSGSRQLRKPSAPEAVSSGSRQLRKPSAPEALRDREGQVERLAAVQPGIARRLVALVQVGGHDLVTAAHALGHVVAGELDVDAARVRAEAAVHL